MERTFLVDPNDPRSTFCTFIDQQEALRFLRLAVLEHDVNLRHFKTVWLSQHHCPGSRPQSDGKALKNLAGFLVSGSLRVARSARPRSYSVRAGVGAMATSQPEPESLNTEKPLSPSRIVEQITPSAFIAPLAPPAPPPRPTPVPVIDVAQQIAVLIQAARDGAPFCEQCENS